MSRARDFANVSVLLFAHVVSRAHGVVVSHLLRMRKALGSNPSVSMHLTCQVRRSSLRPLSLPKSMLANTHRALPDVTWNSSTCRAHETLLNFSVLFSDTLISRAHGVVVSHPLRMRKALGSNPSVSILRLCFAAKCCAATTKVPPGTGDFQMLKTSPWLAAYNASNLVGKQY